jgi:hypothetical protein
VEEVSGSSDSRMIIRWFQGLTQVIECIENDVKGLEPWNIVLGLFDIPMDRRELNVRVKWRSGLCSNL